MKRLMIILLLLVSNVALSQSNDSIVSYTYTQNDSINPIEKRVYVVDDSETDKVYKLIRVVDLKAVRKD